MSNSTCSPTCSQTNKDLQLEIHCLKTEVTTLREAHNELVARNQELEEASKTQIQVINDLTVEIDRMNASFKVAIDTAEKGNSGSHKWPRKIPRGVAGTKASVQTEEAGDFHDEYETEVDYESELEFGKPLPIHFPRNF